ncbi:MAG: hypothetical protein ACI4UA_05845 [Bacteroidaceae bacterium]
MKRIIFNIMYVTAAILLVTSCDDRNDTGYEPGKATAEGCIGVYFDGSNPSEFLLQPGEASEIEIDISRLEGDNAVAEVPLVVTADDGITFPSTVRFEEGECNTTVKVSLGNLEESKVYHFTVTVPEEYADHYTIKSGSTTYSGTIMIATWNTIVDNVKMTWSTLGVTNEFTTTLDRLGDTDRYRFTNFLTSGIDYIFTIGNESKAYVGYSCITTFSNYEPYEGSEAKGAYLFDSATQTYPTWTVADGTIEVQDICILEDYGTTTGYSCISLDKCTGFVYLYFTEYTDGQYEYYNPVSFSWSRE